MNEKHTTHGSGLNLGDIYHVLFRHKWKILLVWAIGLVATAVIWIAWPVPYQSEAKLLVRYLQENRSPSPTPTDSSIQTYGFGSGGIINSELQILTSLDLAQQVADAIGPARILAKIGGGTNRLQAAAIIRSGLKPEVESGSSVIRVVFSHPDRTIVQDVLTQIVDSYLKKHGEIHQGLGQMDEILVQQRDTLRSQLQDTEAELRKTRTNAGMISENDMKNYGDQIFKIRDELFQAEAEIAEHQATLAALTNMMSPNSSITSSGQSNAPPEKVAEYKRVCERLKAQEKTESDYVDVQRLKAESPFVQLVRKQIDETQKRKQELEQEYPQLAYSAINQGNKVGEPVISPTVLLGESTRITALQAKTNILNQYLQNALQKSAAVEQMQARIHDLESTRDVQQKSLEYFSASLDRARLDEQLGAGRASNIKPFESPTPPGKDTTKLLKFLRALLLGTLAGGPALAFVIELYLDRSFKRPSEIEAKLGVPLFLSIPRTSLNGNHGRLSDATRYIRLLPWRSAPEKNGAAEEAPVETPESVPLQAIQRLHPFFEALRDRLIMFFEMKNLTHKPKLVAVTSCGAGSGVTTVASGLAASLSETGDGNVLLVDMNVKGGAAHYFHFGELECGLDDALEMEKRGNALVQDKLYVVKENAGDDKLPRILHKRFSALMPKLHASDYDYIIFDMPPISQISPTPRVARFMDMVMLVVESEKTERDAVRRATELLGESKANVSVVLNKTQNYVPRRLQQD